MRPAYLPGEPQRFRVGENAAAVTLATIMDAVACELGVFRSRGRIERPERRPLSPLAQRLEPVDAQPVGERSFRPSREVSVDLGIGRGVEPELLLPILDVLSQDMIRELRRQRVEAAPFSALERDARVEKVLVRLRERRGHGGAEGGKTNERKHDDTRCPGHDRIFRDPEARGQPRMLRFMVH